MISLVILAKNEENTIGRVIEKCLPYGNEILVIDGHSTDCTFDIARAGGARVVLDSGTGKGGGIRKALKEAAGDVVVFLDADLSHEPEEIPEMVEALEQFNLDLVIGSRILGGSDELGGSFDEMVRRFGNYLITMAINLRFGVKKPIPRTASGQSGKL